MRLFQRWRTKPIAQHIHNRRLQEDLASQNRSGRIGFGSIFDLYLSDRNHSHPIVKVISPRCVDTQGREL